MHNCSKTNHLLQTNGDQTYWLCVTRTVQEVETVSGAGLHAAVLSERLLSLSRGAEENRETHVRRGAWRPGPHHGFQGPRHPSMWGLPCFYLLGREWLINMGLIRPEDAAEDLIYIVEFLETVFNCHGAATPATSRRPDGGHRTQILPERQIQVFHADMYDCEPGERRCTKRPKPSPHRPRNTPSWSPAKAGSACISTGPTTLGENREMLVRDFVDLAGVRPALAGRRCRERSLHQSHHAHGHRRRALQHHSTTGEVLRRNRNSRASTSRALACIRQTRCRTATNRWGWAARRN